MQSFRFLYLSVKRTAMRLLTTSLRGIALLLFFSTAVPVFAQQPLLKVAGADSAMVSLSQFKTTVKVAGNVAITTMEMQFCNRANRVLEGELTFPMPEGVSISRYALDINGAMREAVPIEKEKGQVVFESIERRNVDPGLLEKTTGNTFRTRIYPIPANGCRTIIVGYQQQLAVTSPTAARYDLPLHFKAPIKNFSIEFSVFSSAMPEVGSDCANLLQFEKANEVYRATVAKNEYLPDANFSIVIPQWPGMANAIVQPVNGRYFFLVNSFPDVAPAPKPLPARIGLVWDVSLSGLRRNQANAFALLDAYFKKLQQVSVALTLVGFNATPGGDYTVSGGDWAKLKERLTGLVYDGATQFGALQNWPSADEYLFFTDGLNTYGNGNLRLPGKPVHTVNASPNADFGVLKQIAGQTGGSFVNLEALPVERAVQLLTEQQLQFMGIVPHTAIGELYPLKGTPVTGSCMVTGVSNTTDAEVTLLFGYGNKVTYKKTVALKAVAQGGIAVEKLWAQQKIAVLEQQYEQHKDAITALGKQYGLVTQNTSLIVLDAVEDYVRYEIEPPVELRAAYDRLLQERSVQREEQTKETLEAAKEYYTELIDWWKKDFAAKPVAPKKEHKATSVQLRYSVADANFATANASPPAPSASYGFSTTLAVADSAVAGSAAVEPRRLMGKVPGVTVTSNNAGATANVVLRGLSGTTDPTWKRGRGDNAGKLSYGWADSNKALADQNGESLGTGVAIYDTIGDLSGWKSNNLSEVVVAGIAAKKQQYKKWRDSLQGKDAYANYLAMRPQYMMDPVFYFEAARQLMAQGDTAKGLQVLSNVAELGYDDHELYKMLGYQLKALRQYDAALYAFRKVLQWRPQEPQSYRDYGLALADAGLYQQALDTLHLALVKNYDEALGEMYDGIEEVMVTEINNLIALHGKGLNTGRIDKRLLRNLPVDVRVVLNWNMNDSDIDLWVIDPKGERCFYGNTLTAAGGRISDDFTQGYGPEQFMLKKAPKGRYKVMMNYFSDSQQKIAGPVTVLAEIFTNYGRPNQQRRTIALQMKQDGGEEGVLIGTFTQ
jgi:hypothetical protein